MKRFTKNIALIIVATLSICLSACHYRSINGDLDGNWKLISIEKTDGAVIRPTSSFYAIAMHTINLRSQSAPTATGNISYDKDSKVLYIEFPRTYSMAIYGLPDAPCEVSFDIKQLSSNKLVMQLRSDGSILSFRKF